jgi:hypothetical protein
MAEKPNPEDAAFLAGRDAVRHSRDEIKALAIENGEKQFLAGMATTLVNYTFASAGKEFTLDLLDNLREAIVEAEKLRAH